MKKKRILLSSLLGTLCLAIVIGAFLMNGLRHTHAAGVATTNTQQQTTAKSHAFNVVQGGTYYGSDNTSVYALNATTGAPIWSYQPSGYTVIGLVGVDHGIVYVGLSNTVNGNMNVYVAALKATKGSQLWLSAPITNYGGSVANWLRVTNGVLYVINYVSGGEELQAIKVSDGSLLWHYGGAYGSHISMDALFKGVAYISYSITHAGFSTQVCAFNATTGSQIWCNNNSYGIGFGPGVVYAYLYNYPSGSLAAVVALKASDGTLLWQYAGATQAVVTLTGVYVLDTPMTGPSSVCSLNISNGLPHWCATTRYSSMVVDQGIVYTYDPGLVPAHQGIKAFQGSNGKVLWTKQQGWLLLANLGVVYTSDNSSQLKAFNGKSGALLWLHQISSSIGWLVVSNGALYYESGDYHTLFALNPTNGTSLWQYSVAGQIYQPPVVVNNIVYITSAANGILTVDALDASTGTLLWSH